MRAAPLTCATTPAAVHHGHSPVKKNPASVFLRLRSESEARVGYLQVVEKGSECFESLSMNGKSSMISKFSRSFLRPAQDGL